MYSESEYLQAALDSGMIDLTTLKTNIEMAERKRYLEGHNIWQGKNGYWYTKIKYDGKKKTVRKTTREAIEDEIIRHEKELEETPTVKDVFYMFINQRLRYKDISKSTYDRYETDYNRYIKGKEIEEMKFCCLTEEYLEDFIRCAIADNDLTSKGYANLRTILRGMLLFAKGKYTTISAKSFFGDMQFSKNTFRHKVMNKEEQVFSEDEIKIITPHLKDSETLHDLCILLAFQTGMRVGELVTVQKDDVKHDDGVTMIHIHRTESKEKIDGKTKVLVKDYPKSSAGDRYVYCNDESEITLNKIMAFKRPGQWLFARENGDRFTARMIDHRLRRVCKAIKLPVKSMHKIRKTYGTALIDAGVDESIIIEQMGHSDIHCTKQYYYFSNKSREKKKEQLNRVCI